MPDMECGCTDDYCDYDYEPFEFCNLTWRKARKDYVCCECQRKIPKGEVHEYMSAKWDGDFHQTRTCKQCVTIAEQFMCGCRVYGGGVLREHIWEKLGVDIVTGEIMEGK